MFKMMEEGGFEPPKTFGLVLANPTETGLRVPALTACILFPDKPLSQVFHPRVNTLTLCFASSADFLGRDGYNQKTSLRPLLLGFTILLEGFSVAG